MLEPAIVTRASFYFTIVVEGPEEAREAQSEGREEVGRMFHCEGLLVEAKGAADEEQSGFAVAHAHPGEKALDDVALEEVRRREVARKDHKSC